MDINFNELTDSQLEAAKMIRENAKLAGKDPNKFTVSKSAIEELFAQRGVTADVVKTYQGTLDDIRTGAVVVLTEKCAEATEAAGVSSKEDREALPKMTMAMPYFKGNKEVCTVRPYSETFAPTDKERAHPIERVAAFTFKSVHKHGISSTVLEQSQAHMTHALKL